MPKRGRRPREEGELAAKKTKQRLISRRSSSGWERGLVFMNDAAGDDKSATQVLPRLSRRADDISEASIQVLMATGGGLSELKMLDHGEAD